MYEQGRYTPIAASAIKGSGCAHVKFPAPFALPLAAFLVQVKRRGRSVSTVGAGCVTVSWTYRATASDTVALGTPDQLT